MGCGGSVPTDRATASAPIDLATAVGPPTAATCPPGQCVLPESGVAVKLLERSAVTHDVILVTFGLPDESKPLYLSTCACLLAKYQEEGSPEPVVRPYTPVSTNALIGKFQLVIKVYTGGKMSNHIKDMPIGGSLEFKHIPFNVKIQHPFGKKSITMIVGGTGITPMIQALHAILGTAGDVTQVTLIFGNKTQQDMLCRELLDKWATDYAARLKVVHVLSRANDDSSWKGAKGHITGDLIKEHCAPPSDDTMVVVCGPPPMYESICGPREKGGKPTEADYKGVLKELGYTPEQVFKF